jgi:hypothetical protein
VGIENADFDSVTAAISRWDITERNPPLPFPLCSYRDHDVLRLLEMDGWNDTNSGDGFCCVLLGHEINPPALTLQLDTTCAPFTGVAASSLAFPFVPCVQSRLFLEI